MPINQGWYRLVCRADTDKVTVSERLTRQNALERFALQVAAGGYGPAEPGRVLVVSEAEYAKSLHQVTVFRARAKVDPRSMLDHSSPSAA